MITSAVHPGIGEAPLSSALAEDRVEPLRRVARFGAVGAIGFLFQMGLAWALVRLGRVDPAWAWSISAEAAVLHNFAWHVRWTWADRPASAGETLARLVRFNVSNGAISIVGGAVVMRVLTADFGLPFLVGFVASVGACSLANLLVSEYWAFRAHGAQRAGRPDGDDGSQGPAGTTSSTPAAAAARWRQVACVAAALTVHALLPASLHASTDDKREARQEAFAAYMKRSDAAALERLNGTRPFLWIDENAERRKQALSGGLVIETTHREPTTKVPGGLVHDWTGAVFIPGAKVDEVIGLVQNYDRHKVVYAPEVTDSRLVSRDDQHFVAYMRFRREKIITVILDTVHDARYARLDAARWHSRSVTTSVQEVRNAGQPGERRLGPDEGHGFMLNLNTYWRFAERDGGVYVECQAVSLSRDIPTGLGWLIGPMVQSLPRESLTHTLSATRAALVATPATKRR